MPIIEFTHSEQKWYEREAQLAEAHVRKAEAEAKSVIGKTLAEICASHAVEAPPNATVLKDKLGNAVGLIWGKEEKERLDSARKANNGSANYGPAGATPPPAGAPPPSAAGAAGAPPPVGTGAGAGADGVAPGMNPGPSPA